MHNYLIVKIKNIFSNHHSTYYFTLLSLILLLGCSQGDGNKAKRPQLAPGREKKISLKGSDTGLPISQKMAEEYMYLFPGMAITVVGGGSGVGIAALRAGTTDIAISSRKLKTGEVLKMKANGLTVKELIIGIDALAVVVHPSNPINQLTRQQIEDIYTGKITNWKELGGLDNQIVVISRESSSGTFEFFKEHVLKKKDFVASALMLSATGSIIESVSQNPNAIAYVGIAYVNKATKALKVSFNDTDFYAPSIETAKNKTYPISRPLYFYYPDYLSVKLKSFLDYTVSPAGQKNVLAVGYVPLF
jgi:phosphate transport system substrate-binding protein